MTDHCRTMNDGVCKIQTMVNTENEVVS